MTEFEWIGWTGVALALVTMLAAVPPWRPWITGRGLRLGFASVFLTLYVAVGLLLFEDSSSSTLEWVGLALALTGALGGATAMLVAQYRSRTPATPHSTGGAHFRPLIVPRRRPRSR